MSHVTKTCVAVDRVDALQLPMNLIFVCKKLYLRASTCTHNFILKGFELQYHVLHTRRKLSIFSHRFFQCQIEFLCHVIE